MIIVKKVSQEGFEPSTPALKGRYSTAELLAQHCTIKKEENKLFTAKAQGEHVKIIKTLLPEGKTREALGRKRSLRRSAAVRRGTFLKS